MAGWLSLERKQPLATLVIYDVLEERNEHTYEFSESRAIVMSNTRQWKSMTRAKMLEHAAHEKELARSAGGDLSMADSTDPTKPYRHFESNFTPDKFEEVFYWAKPILDYDKSSDFGKWYVRSIYANIAVQVKLCHDHKEANDDKEYLYAWSQLIKFWDALTRHEQYKDIDKGCFAAKMSSAKRR